MLADAGQRYLAMHYCMVGDKPRVLTVMKNIWQEHLAGVFPRRWHCALDSTNTVAYTLADLAVPQIDTLLKFDLVTVLGNTRFDRSNPVKP